jgi:hypothetical protein
MLTLVNIHSYTQERTTVPPEERIAWSSNFAPSLELMALVVVVAVAV